MSAEELINIINENDEVIGHGKRAEVHNGEELFQVVHIFVRNAAGQFLLQQRSPQKGYPNLLQAGAGGHVLKDELRDDAAERELKEELGAEGELRKLDVPLYVSGHRNARAQLYEVTHEGPFEFTDGEVIGTDWFDGEELDFLTERMPYIFMPGFLNAYKAFKEAGYE
jgi:isopentenyldiphosphate isomerase